MGEEIKPIWDGKIYRCSGETCGVCGCFPMEGGGIAICWRAIERDHAALEEARMEKERLSKELANLHDLRFGVKQLENDVHNLGIDLARLVRY